MVIHEAVSMAQPMKAIGKCCEEFQKVDTILIGPEYLLSTISPGGYVVKGSGIFNP
jgi:hypothetical protein